MSSLTGSINIYKSKKCCRNSTTIELLEFNIPSFFTRLNEYYYKQCGVDIVNGKKYCFVDEMRKKL